MASVAEDRSKAIAFTTGGMALGLTCGPSFQVLFSFISRPGWKWTEHFSLHMFNAPALLAFGVSLVAVVLLVVLFRESYVGVIEKKGVEEDGAVLPPFDRVAIAICCCLRFTQMFTFTNLET